MNTTTEPNIKPGYKNTPVGIIPEDWEVKKLKSVSKFRNGKAHEDIVDDEGEYILVNSKFVSTQGEVAKNVTKNVSPLYRNEIAIVMSDVPNGRAIAKCFYIDKDNKYTLNQRIGGISAEEVGSKFLFYQLNRNKYYLKFDNGVSQTNLRKGEVLGCPLAIPPLQEQNSIANCLSTWDSGIEKLTQLIQAKKQQKKGLMQQLLTGKKRLAGFDGEWKEVRLGKLFKIVGGGTPSTTVSEYWNGEIQWFTPTEIKTKYLKNSKRTISELGLKNSSAKLLPEGTLLFTSRATIGDAGFCATACSTNQGFQSFIPNSKSNIEFLYYWIQVNKKVFLRKASGSTFLEISKKEMGRITLRVPSLTEQTAIANILQTADQEIGLLGQKLSSFLQQKKGLMQVLLTGEKRLVE